jgi:hypothetical protein
MISSIRAEWIRLKLFYCHCAAYSFRLAACAPLVAPRWLSYLQTVSKNPAFLDPCSGQGDIGAWYNADSQTFLDLVDDPHSSNSPDSIRRLRIQAGCRKLRPAAAILADPGAVM